MPKDIAVEGTPEDDTVHGGPVHEDPLRGELVRRHSDRSVRSRVRPDLSAVRGRVVELARNPAAVAAATVVTGLAVNVVREVARSGVLRRTPAVVPVEITGQVVHYVHVIHHHVVHHRAVHHHVGYPAYLPRIPPVSGW